MLKRPLVLFPLALVGVVLAAYLALPWGLTLRWRAPGATAFMEQRVREAESRGEPLRLDYRFIPLEKIAPALRRAVVVAEDARFYEHRGIDWRAIREEVHYQGDSIFHWTDARDLKALVEAIQYYRAHKERIRGRSTITQQLAKNLYFSGDRSLARKVAELVVARRLEWTLSKDRILELYLNTAEWGPGIFGAEAAARTYFGRSAANLTREQAAALAATLPHPLTSNPKHRPGRMEWRKRMILSRMGGKGKAATVPLAVPDSVAG